MRDQPDQPTLTLHIATDGRDTWSGAHARPTADATDGPLATLAAARDRLRALRQADQLTGAARVLVQAGRYEQPATLVFGPDDLGDAAHPVTFEAAEPGSVYLTGSARLTGVAAAPGTVAAFDLRGQGLAGRQFRQLFCDGVRQRLARYPNADPANPYGGGWLYVPGERGGVYEDGQGEKSHFPCADPRPATWATLDGVEIVVFPRYNYFSNTLPVSAYDAATGTVSLGKPATYEIYPGDRFYFQNIREELDTPGEWYHDRDAETLHLCIPDAGATIIEVPQVDHLLVVCGEPERPIALTTERWPYWEDELRLFSAPEAVERGYLTFSGFVMEGCDGNGVVFQGVRGCQIAGCTVRNTGGMGVLLLGGAACGVTACDIYQTGAEGIALVGGQRWPFAGRFLPGDHEATDNYIHHIGVFDKHVAGIALNGVGLTAAHNLIHDAPRWGFLSRGNDQRLAYNHIRHVNLETADTAAIDLCDRDFSLRGTVIEYNRIHDVLGYNLSGGRWRSPSYAFGIYLDDWTSGVTVRGNLTYRTPRGGIYLHAGQDNLVENNMFLDTVEELGYFRRWEGSRELHFHGTHNQGLRRNRIRRNIFAARAAAPALYRFNNATDQAGALDIATNEWQENLIWCGGSAPRVLVGLPHAGEPDTLGWDEWRARGFDDGSVIADPGIEDGAAEDFRLRDNSPALALGFVPLPLDEMGPRPHPLRAIWPIVEAPGAREFPLVAANAED